MELTNTFTVSVPVEDAWAVLTDVERIAPCLPGAQLQEIEGDEYRGIVKVKVGPITAQYKGKATFKEKDDTAHKAVLEASGRDTRGQGNANATITAVLVPAGEGTEVTVTTDLTVTGKVAQFGRGVLADVSSKLLGQFVDNLEQTVLVDETAVEDATEVVEEAEAVLAAEIDAEATQADAALEGGYATAGMPSSPTAPTVRKVDMPEPEAIDLLEHAGSPVLKRAVPVLGVALVVFILWRVLRRR
jgi:carbon monoxide dehydrogenase subunit G